LAILAAMPTDEAEMVLTINAPAITKRYPNMTLDTVRRMLHEKREQGYSVIPGVLAPGYWGVGVAVLRPDGEPVAAVVLNALANRMSGARQAVIAG
jgi:DNA-binding IclR family transcriptional regulator